MTVLGLTTEKTFKRNVELGVKEVEKFVEGFGRKCKPRFCW